jgi:hypothetical protein
MIQLNNPLTVTVQPARTVTITEIQILSIVDNPQFKRVVAWLDQVGELVLWEGNAYDLIGDWKQVDAEARIVELLGA